MRRHAQRGMAMVEFAISTPLLFLLLLAVVEFGRAFYQYNQLVSAARDAARYLASSQLDTTGVVTISPTASTAAKYLAVYGNAAGSGSPLLPNLSTSQVTIATDASNNISVSIAYPYQSMFGGTIPTFGSGGSIGTGNLVLQAYTSMLAL